MRKFILLITGITLLYYGYEMVKKAATDQT